jgi:hypothetical protein
MPKCSRAQRRALANARAALAARRAARQPPDVMLVRLLNPNRWRHIHNLIISYLNETEFANLLGVPNRRLRKNLLDHPPPRKKVCEAHKHWPLGPLNGRIDGQFTTCWITSRHFQPPSLRPCEGPQLGINYAIPPEKMHNSTFEICADCANDALFTYHPDQSFRFTPLCRPCSLADADAQCFPSTWTCRCLSPFSSRAVKARLCQRCRRVLSAGLELKFFLNMETKLPVRRPWIPVADADELRWRTAEEDMLGGWLVGCRSCGIGDMALIQSYYDNPVNWFGPIHNPNDPNYENWRDRDWQFKAMRCMVLKCLECDGNVGWYSVALGDFGAP